MNVLERSSLLRKEADEIIVHTELVKHCASIGKITYSGSYFLDLMMYPDIDIYLPETTMDKMLDLAKCFARNKQVEMINFRKGLAGPLRNALYLSPRLEMGNWGRHWKIDIWAVDEKNLQEKQNEIIAIKNQLTEEKRKIILEYKYRILTQDGRTPMYSGIFIYRAVLNHGLIKFDEITDYLRQNGVKI